MKSQIRIFFLQGWSPTWIVTHRPVTEPFRPCTILPNPLRNCVWKPSKYLQSACKPSTSDWTLPTTNFRAQFYQICSEIVSKNLQNTFKVHVNHRPVIEPFQPPTFVPISIKSFPKLCLKVGWWMWILVKNGQLWPNFGSTRSRRNRWKSPETNELDRVLSLHTRFCYDPSSGYKVVTLRSETQMGENLGFVTPNPGSGSGSVKT